MCILIYVPADIDVCIEFYNLLECCGVYARMYWLLVKKEYIIMFIMFVFIISTIVYYAVRVTMPKGITVKYPKASPIFPDPGPESIVINFIYSNHV